MSQAIQLNPSITDRSFSPNTNVESSSLSSGKYAFIPPDETQQKMGTVKERSLLDPSVQEFWNCVECGRTIDQTSSLWIGPLNAYTLCDQCGPDYKKQSKRIQAAIAAGIPIKTIPSSDFLTYYKNSSSTTTSTSSVSSDSEETGIRFTEISIEEIKSGKAIQSNQGRQVTGKKRGRKPVSKKGLRCHHCWADETPEWRKGPNGPNTLCNACGLDFAKRQKKYKQGSKDVMSLDPPQTNKISILHPANTEISGTAAALLRGIEEWTEKLKTRKNPYTGENPFENYNELNFIRG
jgi:hypothetical protein